MNRQSSSREAWRLGRLLAGLAVLVLAVASPTPAQPQPSMPTGTPFYIAIDIVQAEPGGTPTVHFSPDANCGTTISFVAEIWATVTCHPAIAAPPGGWSCDAPLLEIHALQGEVSAQTNCQVSPFQAIGTQAPGVARVVHLSTGYGFPFRCQATFSYSAEGSVHCHEADP